MSYRPFENADFGYVNNYFPTTLMMNDILAIQHLYGADYNFKDTNGDGNINDIYKWSSNASIFETIYDAGGNDTIDASNQTSGVILDLQPSHFSTIGTAFYNGTTNVRDYLGLSYEVKDSSGNVVNYIENAMGSAFDDILIGNNTINNLTGGTGKDTFVFNSKLLDTINIDHIMDFSHIDDIINLDNSLFGSLIDGALSMDNFVLNTTALDNNDYLLYNSTNGYLSYDVDGNGSSLAVHFATIDNKPTDITYQDFYVI